MANPTRSTVLPGFRLTLGFTIFYLCLIVLVPLLTLPARTATMGWNAIWRPSAIRAWSRLTSSASARRLIAAVRQRGVRPHRGVGAGALSVSRQAHRRRIHRFAVCAADGRRRHHVDDAVRAKWMAWRAARANRRQGGVYAAGNHGRAGVHRSAVRRANAAAGHRGSGRRDRGGGHEPRREPRATC